MSGGYTLPGQYGNPREALTGPCGDCWNCQYNARVKEEAANQRKWGAEVEVLGAEKPCQRWEGQKAERAAALAAQ